MNTDDYFCPQVAVSLAACVYFLNDRLKSIGRAFILGYVFLDVYFYNWVILGLIMVRFSGAWLGLLNNNNSQFDMNLSTYHEKKFIC